MLTLPLKKSSARFPLAAASVAASVVASVVASVSDAASVVVASVLASVVASVTASVVSVCYGKLSKFFFYHSCSPIHIF